MGNPIFDVIRGGGWTILSGFDKKAFENVFTQARMDVHTQEELDNAAATAGARDAGAIKMLEMDQQEYTKLLSQQTQAVGKFGSTKASVKGLSEKVAGLLRKLDLLEREIKKDPGLGTDKEKLRPYVKDIVAGAQGIRSTVGRPNAKNLLSSDWAEYSYQATENKNTITMKGQDIATNYEIRLANGMVWKLDRDSGSVLRETDAQGNATGREINVDGGILKKVSESGDQITLDVKIFNKGKVETETLTGTFVRKGLRIADPWYYDGLATQAGRDKLRADLEGAKSGLAVQSLRYEGAENLAKFYSERTRGILSGLSREIGDRMVAQVTKVEQAKAEIMRQAENRKNLLAQEMALRDMMTGFVSSVVRRNGSLIGVKNANFLSLLT